QRSSDDLERVDKKLELVAIEQRGAGEQRLALDARQREARESIARLENEQRIADNKLSQAQHCLGDARDGLQGLARRSAEAKAANATHVEPAAALQSEVAHLQTTHAELEARVRAAESTAGDL